MIIGDKLFGDCMFWNKFYLISYGFILASVLFFMSSCHENNGGKNNQQLDMATASIDKNTNSLDGTTKVIKNEANEILKQTPPEIKPKIDPHANEILVQTGKQEEIIKDLQQTKELLNKEKLDKASIIKENDSLKDSLNKEKENSTKQLRAKYTTVSIFCFAGMIVCGALFFTGQKWAMGVGLMCAAGLAVSIALVQTVALIPYIAGGIIGLLAIVAIISFVRKNWTIKDLKQIGTELVHSAEAAKPFMQDSGRRTFYGDGPIPGKVLHLQSDKTQEFVNEVRNNMPENKKAPSIEPTVAVDVNGDGVIDEKDVIISNEPLPINEVEEIEPINKKTKGVTLHTKRVYIILR